MNAQEWQACTDPRQMLDALPPFEYHSGRYDRKLRLFVCACARRLLHLMTDDRSRRALEVAERFADGEATEEERWRAVDEVYAVLNARIERVADDWVMLALSSMITEDVEDSRLVVDPHLRAGGPQPPSTDQADLLREIFGNPFAPVRLPWHDVTPTVWDDPVATTKFECPWLTRDTMALARIIYDERRWEELPCLADALEEASCQDEVILRHLRGAEPGRYFGIRPDLWIDLRGPHVPGCWCLDLLLEAGQPCSTSRR